MTYQLAVCPRPGCSARHGVTVTRPSKRGPAKRYSGEYVSPLRPASREAAQGQPLTRLELDPARLREATGTASPDSPESSRSKAAGAVMPGSRSPRPVARALRVGG